MVSKYYEDVYEILDTEEMKSTFTICEELKEKAQKQIAWIMVYSILRDLERESRAIVIKTKHSLFWRKK